MPSYVQDLRSVIELATPALLALGEPESARHPAPGRWSPRQILGHLIDSASNNHQRFVRAVAENELVFPGYDQDLWVAIENYQEEPWTELVALWRAFNMHLAHVMAAIPETVRERKHTRHNLDEIGWKTIPSDTPATLDDLMADYVDHLKHHLRQIVGASWYLAAAPSESSVRRS